MAASFDPATDVLLEPAARSLDQIENRNVVDGVSLIEPLPSTLAPALPLATVTTPLREEGNSRTIDLVVSRPGFLVLAYTYYPGWRARVDDQPVEILRANYAFMALPLGPGEHRVILRYQPMSFKIGAIISSLSLLLIVIAALRGIDQNL
jgi:hypothetical protein